MITHKVEVDWVACEINVTLNDYRFDIDHLYASLLKKCVEKQITFTGSVGLHHTFGKHLKIKGQTESHLKMCYQTVTEVLSEM